ncbi:polysaccharide biosynthesis protein [Chryseobacterium indoltheticum]|uniref:NDP-sugar epimerase, includes UDP-GlcNAc-inverting 4,6-dehydratase FlaA1 and capsular polysaccharide biosynthesis protein EpsC n=1 Tax=Chryseobacterium indoltheticum TaxID=254 RepID=A0A381F6J5_9FLAO|nr:nucleoside-diphosphate sugar epimerase/dehydratase [Chryseobacterium indoltheticum]AZA75237.1 polysaccharide biosynthesis protein [Chryseobacterium indoltheticum]SIR15440.1 NDP-sugar epimerase, includes UDP-GlcNAc-inverting 4,6-dehydratase FlaA1 and capsular polysaccharide biosynthesis protein EpsC [Chryseobacterium indoltheticum]SUX41732.1 UDP-glucose 4-epimerase [Chryseobacterium indoltheticum]
MKKLDDAFSALYKGDNIVKLTELRYIPRWIVIIIDISIILLSIFLAYILLDRLRVQVNFPNHRLEKRIILIAVNLLFMFVFRTYAGIIRHSTFFDLFKIVLSSGSTLVTLIFLNFFIELLFDKPLYLYPTLFLYFFISISLMFFFRMVTKQFFNILIDIKGASSKTRVAVVGISDASVSLARAILHNPNYPYRLEGFVTKRSDSNKAVLLGHKIYNSDYFFKNKNITDKFDAVLIIKEIMSKQELEEWMTLALDHGLKVLKAPTLSKMRDSDLVGGIRQLQIEDLLNRRPIKIENEEVTRRHAGKSVLVTGGAGSIGSEIVRQVAQFSPSLIIVLDQAESPLYELELELLEKFPDQKFKFVLADISNSYRLEKIFELYHFSMVYHAAAYKHVPLIEENPHEAIFVNVLGTKNVALLSKKYKVNRFVMVSTDKAVNPTNVMGASKRTAELFVQSLQNTEGNTTKFITTRFGNVLGSNGSVIPHFRKQIEKGGPVTITHPDIIRYFMTIPEACELVLQAGTMGDGGEIYVFDMGEPVKILDLARRMIKLSGYIPDEEIKIKFIGLRPGEKLYEELLSNNATTVPTHHEKIMISKDPYLGFEEIDLLCKQIIKSAVKRDKIQVVTLLKAIVPEFISNNSEFELLDIKDNDIIVMSDQSPSIQLSNN